MSGKQSGADIDDKINKISEIFKPFDQFLKQYRFPLFTYGILYLLTYKLAYEFLKTKGLLKEFEIWCKSEGIELTKTFFKEGLEMIEEGEEEEKKRQAIKKAN